MLLMEKYSELYKVFKSTRRKRVSWAEVMMHLQEHGYQFTKESCQARLKALKAK